jgi:hypothetical protein
MMKRTQLCLTLLLGHVAHSQTWPKPSRFFPDLNENISISYPTANTQIKHCGPASKKLGQTDQNISLSFLESGTHRISFTKTSTQNMSKSLFISTLDEDLATAINIESLSQNLEIETKETQNIVFDIGASSIVDCDEAEFTIQKNTNGSFKLLFKNKALVGTMLKHTAITNKAEELEGQHTPKNGEVSFDFKRGIHLLHAEYIDQEAGKIIYYKTTYCFGKK